ncbi:BA14K family protein [Aquamicrobium ahrensii]
MSAFCASSLSLAFGMAGVAPSAAAPVAPVAPITVSGVQSDFQTIQYKRQLRKRPNHQSNANRRGHWKGYTGQRSQRRGYRRHSDGFWYPLAAFGLGAAIGGAIANQPQGGNAHVQWCYGQYRSYRASDNTFQPYNGPRRQCRSPY